MKVGRYLRGIWHRPRLVLGTLTLLTLLAHVRYFLYSGAGLIGTIFCP